MNGLHLKSTVNHAESMGGDLKYLKQFAKFES